MDRDESEPKQKSRLSRFGWVLIVLLYALSLWGLTNAIQTQRPDDPRCSWTALITDSGHRPFVYRALVPWLVQTLDGITPAWLRDMLDGPAQHIGASLGGTADQAFALSIAYALAMACLIGLAFLLAALLREVYAHPPWVVALAPLGLFVVLRFDMWYWFYVYDAATLFLSALLLFLLIRQQLLLYYGIFVLALLNKETSVLMIGVFVALQLGRMPRPRLLMAVALQALAFLLVRSAVHQWFSAYPGASFEFQLTNNLAFLSSFTVASAYFYLRTSIYLALIFRDWPKKPKELRWALLCQSVPLLALGMLFGRVEELRIFYELIPLTFLLSVPTALDALGILEAPYQQRLPTSNEQRSASPYARSHRREPLRGSP